MDGMDASKPEKVIVESDEGSVGPEEDLKSEESDVIESGFPQNKFNLKDSFEEENDKDPTKEEEINKNIPAGHPPQQSGLTGYSNRPEPRGVGNPHSFNLLDSQASTDATMRVFDRMLSGENNQPPPNYSHQAPIAYQSPGYSDPRMSPGANYNQPYGSNQPYGGIPPSQPFGNNKAPQPFSSSSLTIPIRTSSLKQNVGYSPTSPPGYNYSPGPPGQFPPPGFQPPPFGFNQPPPAFGFPPGPPPPGFNSGQPFYPSPLNSGPYPPPIGYQPQAYPPPMYDQYGPSGRLRSQTGAPSPTQPPEYWVNPNGNRPFQSNECPPHSHHHHHHNLPPSY